MSEATELAAQHDAARRHEDAVNALAVAARAGDFEAMAQLGERLLVGDRGPHLPRDGARLLADAARGGSAEAALRLACLAALGAHVEQNWSRALGLLAYAAEQGSESARGQLRLLSRREGAPGSSESWRQRAEAVDVAAWLSPASGTTLHEQPLVRHFPEFVSDAACGWVIEHARERLRPALIYSAQAEGDTADEMRTNSVGVLHLACIDVVHVIVQHRIAAACKMPVDNLEGPTILRYAVGEQITNHFDFINPSIPNYAQEIATRGERLITFLLYLNDDYQAGETDFPKIHVRHKGRRGEGLFFVNVTPAAKPDARMVHAGLPPTSGEKWILSQFVRTNAVFNTPAENVA